MDERQFLRARSVATASVAAAEWIFLVWQHLHGGVASHHLLARADLPAISNGWGGLILPWVTWFLIGRVHRRVTSPAGMSMRYAVAGFISALCFGALLSIFFTLGNDQVTGLMFESLFLIALVAPIYRAEYLLGFVLGMAYTFGGVLPSIIGSVMALITLVIHRYIRAGLLRVGGMFIRVVKRA
ncbi:hypothetical protein [Dyella japonica]|uniref:hypothetical protein n=1 Tax=Dyella japonica TaxID=231455 RepID=UPI00035F1B0F|nr:hypothetical protein [Dyella japonica]